MAYNITKIRSSSTIKKVAYVFIVIFCLLTIQNLIRSIYNLWNKQDLVVKAKNELEREKQESRRLKVQFSYVKSEEFVESEARDKLFMVKPGESGVIVPQDLVKKKKEKSEIELANWKKWINLFGF